MKFYIVSYLALTAYVCLCYYIYQIDMLNIDKYNLVIKRCNNTSEYSIYGLIGQRKEKDVTYCANKFNARKIESLIPKMEKEWYTCFENNGRLWKYIWKKSGSCIASDEMRYFNLTLSLFREAIANNYTDDCLSSRVLCTLKFDRNLVYVR